MAVTAAPPARLRSPKDTVSGRGVLLPALCRMCSPGSNYRCSGKHSVVGVNADFQIPFKELQVALESVRHHTGQDPTALQLLQESNKRAGTEGLTEQNWGDANQPGLLLLRCAEMLMALSSPSCGGDTGQPCHLFCKPYPFASRSGGWYASQLCQSKRCMRSSCSSQTLPGGSSLVTNLS